MRCTICGGDRLVPARYIIRTERCLEAQRCEDCGALHLSDSEEAERISRVQAIVAAIEQDEDGQEDRPAPAEASFTTQEAPTGAGRQNDGAPRRARRLAKS